MVYQSNSGEVPNKFNADISKREIRQQVELILKSAEFVASDRYTSFLKYLVNEVLEGRADTIKAYPIGLEVFDRDPDFDPQSDPIVRVYAGRLRNKLELYYKNKGTNDPVIIEIPKGTYVPHFNRRQQAKAPEPANTSSSPARPEINKQLKGKKKLAIGSLIGVAALLLASTIYLLQGNHYLKSDGRMSITIRQFDNLSPEKDNDYLARRISSEIATELSRFTNVKVTGPIDKESETKWSSGHYILEGDLYRENENLKVHVNLKDARSGVNTWSDLYTRNLKSMAMLYIESDIASRVTVAIADDFGFVQTMMGKQAVSEPINQLTAHQALLLYYDYVGNMNAESHQRALEALEKAISQSHHHAPAWAALAGLYMDKYKHFDGDTSHRSKAIQAVETAAAIDPYNRHVQEHLSLVAFSTDQLDDFKLAVEKQLELYPNATMRGQLGMHLCLTGDFERGLPLIEEVQASNPYYPGFLHFGHYFYYLQKGAFKKALYEAEMVNMPGLLWDPLARTVALAQMGDKDQANKALAELLALKPNFATNGLETLDRALYLEKHIELIVNGLEKAGLNMDRSNN